VSLPVDGGLTIQLQDDFASQVLAQDETARAKL
jgi:hypothetical protein